MIKFNKILITLFFFFLAGIFEIGGGYLVWLWFREGMSWMLGALGGFVLFLYGIVPTFQPSHFHRILCGIWWNFHYNVYIMGMVV